MSNGDQGNNEGGPADKTETQTTVLPPTETEAQEQVDETQQGAATQSSDPAGSAAPRHRSADRYATLTAGERIAALQREIEETRAAEAEAHKDDPFVLHLAPGIIGDVYHVTKTDVLTAREKGITVLQVVAEYLGLPSPEHLYQVNQAEIDRTAREAGFAGGSDNGLIVPEGTGLHIEPTSAVKEPAGVH